MIQFLNEAGVFEVLNVADWSAGKSSQSGTPYLELVLTTPKGDVKYRGYLTDKTAQKTLDSLMALGFKGDDASDFATKKTGLFAVPKGVTVSVEAESYEGKVYFKAKWINAPKKKDLADVAAVLREAGFDALLMKAKRSSQVETEEFPF